MTSAGLVLAGTFVVFGVVAGGGSGGRQIRDIGLGLALGILMDTFVVRTVLVPSTVVLLGRWNWWPSKLHMSRRDGGGGSERGRARASEGGRTGRADSRSRRSLISVGVQPAPRGRS